jgi:hypothetical protein
LYHVVNIIPFVFCCYSRASMLLASSDAFFPSFCLNAWIYIYLSILMHVFLSCINVKMFLIHLFVFVLVVVILFILLFVFSCSFSF